MIFSETFTVDELKAKASKDYDRIMKAMMVATKDDAKLSKDIGGAMFGTSMVATWASLAVFVAAPAIATVALPALLTIGATSLAGAGMSKLMEKMFQTRMINLAKLLESPSARNVFVNEQVARVQESNLRFETVGRWRLNNQNKAAIEPVTPTPQPRLR